MKLMDIQTHSDYVELMNATHLKKWELHRKRVEFGRQPLTLGIFIPCDEEGNVLEEPDFWDANGRAYDPKLTHRYCDSKIKEYHEAKKRILFEGFMLIHIHNKRYKQALVAKDKEGKGQFDIYDYETIEDLVFMDLTLTPNAIKQLGL